MHLLAYKCKLELEEWKNNFADLYICASKCVFIEALYWPLDAFFMQDLAVSPYQQIPLYILITVLCMSPNSEECF